MNLRHILVRHEYEAHDLLRKLNAGEAFDALARKHSTCSSREAGGDLGDMTGKMHRLVDEFREAAEKLSRGERSPPVRTRFGYHLILRY